MSNKNDDKKKRGRPILNRLVQSPKTGIEEEGWDKDGLTVRQRMFVAALVGPAGGNATNAGALVGYRSENRLALRATVSKILGYPHVQQAIAHALAAQRLTPEWAKLQLADMASASMANFATVDSEGRASLDFAKAAAMGAMGQIKEWSEEVINLPDGGETILKRKLKLHDRTAALGMLLKFHKLVDGTEDAPEELNIKMRPMAGGTVRSNPDADADPS